MMLGDIASIYTRNYIHVLLLRLVIRIRIAIPCDEAELSVQSTRVA